MQMHSEDWEQEMHPYSLRFKDPELGEQYERYRIDEILKDSRVFTLAKLISFTGMFIAVVICIPFCAHAYRLRVYEFRARGHPYTHFAKLSPSLYHHLVLPIKALPLIC